MAVVSSTFLDLNDVTWVAIGAIAMIAAAIATAFGLGGMRRAARNWRGSSEWPPIRLSLLYAEAQELAAAEHAAQEEVRVIIGRLDVWRAVGAMASMLEQSGWIDPVTATALIDDHL